MYCRHRIRGIDSRFRRDVSYIFFLMNIKEMSEIKRSIQTFMRQARRLPSLKASQINEIKMENLEKYNRTYSVFKNMRGTTSYYQGMKKDAMATLRQKGSPTIFFTLSFAEFQSDELFRQILETNMNRTITDDEFKEMGLTSTERNKIVQENVVQTTITFQRRLEKVIQLLMDEGFTYPDAKYKYRVGSYFYRIEFQLRYFQTSYFLISW